MMTTPCTEIQRYKGGIKVAVGPVVKLLKSRWWNATFLPLSALPILDPLPSFSLSSIPLRSRPAQFQLMVLGKRSNLPLRGQIVFGAFKP